MEEASEASLLPEEPGNLYLRSVGWKLDCSARGKSGSWGAGGSRSWELGLGARL
jgi:hypothetical protein